MAQEVDTNEQFADQQSHCEIDKIRKAEGECLRLGEVQLDGSLLCVRHAELLRLEDHSETMLGEKFEMDQWLEGVDSQADELGVRRAQHHRDDLVEQIKYNRMAIELIRDELRKDHDGTTCSPIDASPSGDSASSKRTPHDPPVD